MNRANGTCQFAVKAGRIAKAELAKTKSGTKTSHGSNFTCPISGAAIPWSHTKAESMAGRMGAHLMAVVAESQRAKVYLEPTKELQE